MEQNVVANAVQKNKEHTEKAAALYAEIEQARKDKREKQRFLDGAECEIWAFR
jgi:hypothetical protein